MNQLSGKSYTAYIGIDWASSKHDICLQVAGSEDRAFERIKHTPEAIEDWARALYQRLGYVETGRKQDRGYDRVFFRKAL